MWSNTATKFDSVREREAELNARQREILGLIEKGHTNREIAEMLDISVDGAKWNVSEILTKLGLDSREEAAEYWRWRRGRVPVLARGLRALFGLPAAKWVAGSTAVVGVAGIGAMAAIAGGAEPDLIPAPSPTEFYVEATIHRVDPEYPNDYELRWWHKDADHTRWDFDTVSPPIKTTHTTTVVLGTQATSFSVEGATRREFMAPAAHGAIRRPADVVIIGPSSSKDVAALLAELSGWDGGRQAAQVVGYEAVNGFQTTVIEYVAGTMWVEPARMLVVQHHSDSFRATMTLFESRVIQPREVALSADVVARPTATPFVFNPGQPRLLPDAGFLQPGYLPEGTGDIGFRGGALCLGGEACWTESIYMSDTQAWENQGLPGIPLRNGKYVEVKQRVGLTKMPESLKIGTPVNVRGVTGYLESAATPPAISWQEPDGRIIRIEGSQVSAEEILKVAEGLVAPTPAPVPTAAP